MPRHILCVQLADIGDLILTTPALGTLRAALPSAHITLLTTPHAAPILPPALVDNVIAFPKHTFDRPAALMDPRNAGTLTALARQIRTGKYDTMIFFHHFSTGFGLLKFIALAALSGARLRVGLQGGGAFFLNAGIPERGFGALHQADYWRQLAGVAAGVPVSRRGSAQVAQAPPPPDLPPKSARVRVAIHAGSGGYSLARRWQPQRFAQVIQHLAAQHTLELLIVGSPSDDSGALLAALDAHALTVPVMDLTGKTTLPQLAGTLATADVFIGADSGVMHTAAAVGVPIVALFGTSNAAAWQPYPPEQHTIVSSGARCAPCSYVGTGVGLRDGCAARTCMHMLTPAQVSAAADALLSGAAAPKNPMPPPVPAQRARVSILGVPVDKLPSYEALLSHLEAWIAARDGLHHLCTVNPEFVMIAQRDPNFYNILNRADLCLADGIGLLYAARYLGESIPMRLTGSDGVPIIAARAAERGWKLFLLGGWDGIGEQAAAVLRARFPNVQIVGIYSGSPKPQDEDDIVQRVNAANADILFVAYGAPQQDAWIARNAPRLNVVVAMGVGGALDYLAGAVPLAPAWMRRAGLEWLFRLVRQPWRFRRQLRLPLFVMAVLWRGKRATQKGQTHAD